MSEGGSCDETIAKKVITLRRATTKKGRQILEENNRWHRQVAAPGDTNLSDATGYISKKARVKLGHSDPLTHRQRLTGYITNTARRAQMSQQMW